MASRHKLAESPFYKAKSKSRGGGRGTKTTGKAKKVFAKNEQTSFEKKMALRSEAKEIMGRIDKLTVDYDGAVSQVVVGSSAEAKGAQAGTSMRSLSNLASSKDGGVGEERGVIKQHVISSELQFKKFQQDKGRMTMIMLDHVKVSWTRWKGGGFRLVYVSAAAPIRTLRTRRIEPIR
jgi:hypothetical protein